MGHQGETDGPALFTLVSERDSIALAKLLHADQPAVSR